MSNLVTVLANANGRRPSAIGLAATTIARRSLILASLVLAATIMLPSAPFAAPVGSVGAVGAVGPSPALNTANGQDPPVTFNFNLGGNIGSGSLMTTNVGGGQFQATSGTLTMASTSVNDAGNTYCLVPATVPLPTFTGSPLGAFIYDNLVTPGANPAFPTTGGLLFSNTYPPCNPGANASHEINIWTTTPPSPGYSFYDYGADTHSYVPQYSSPTGSNDSFTATVVSTTYSYAGRGFKLFECLTLGTPDCPSPGAGNPYQTSNSVTAALQMAAPLCATNNSCSTAPINVLCSQDFVTLTMNDGLNTLTVNSICSGGATAWVATDANGNINAWYLHATGGGSKEIHTLYDPQGAIAGACDGCLLNMGEQDYGQFAPTQGPPLVFGYNLGSHGSFTPGYTGGTTTAGNCSNGQTCNLVPGNTFVILGPNKAAIPSGAVLTEQECVVPVDPRGPNCGAVNGHRPSTLNVSSLPQCQGFGNEVIPDHLCGASGSSGTGFALILGNAEQVDTFNGTYGDSELDVEQVPGLAGAATNPTCPKGLPPGTPPVRVSALAAVGTRSGSLVEEQTPELTLDGRPMLVEMTSSCEPPKSNHGPGLTLEGMGFKLRTKDPTVRGGPTDAQNLLLLANYKYFNLDVVMLLTKFPTNTPTRKNLQSCINKSQTLLNSGPSHYICAAEQVFRCEQMVDGTDFNQFGPTAGPFLRLPDPYGDVVRRLGNLFYTINTRINLQPPNSDWPLPTSLSNPTGDPYPNQCQ